MSRLGFIARHPKRALSALATLLVAAGLTVGSGAFVADQAASDGNSIEAGTADLVMYGSSGAAIDAANCRANDDFIDPAGTSTSCNQGGVTNDPAKTATFQVTNLSPGQPALNRCFYVGSKSDIPLGMRLDVDQLTGNADLAKAINIQVVRDAGALAANGFNGVTISRKVLANDTLWNLAAGAPFKADVDPDNTTNTDDALRQPLEAGQGQRYCVLMSLTNEARDQNEIEGKTVGFGINALGQSLYGADLDAGRA
jgi:hypothetical protein